MELNRTLGLFLRCGLGEPDSGIGGNSKFDILLHTLSTSSLGFLPSGYGVGGLVIILPAEFLYLNICASLKLVEVLGIEPR